MTNVIIQNEELKVLKRVGDTTYILLDKIDEYIKEKEASQDEE